MATAMMCSAGPVLVPEMGMQGEVMPRMSLDEQLRESDRDISEAWIGLVKRSMVIGWDGYFIKRNDGWQRLGYADEKHYRSSKGIGRSTWYKMVGLAEKFPMLNKEQFLAMTIENAEQLAAVPLSARGDAVLVEAASSMTAKDFEGELVRATAIREAKPVAEVYVTIKWRIKQAQREVIEHGLEDWQQEHGIDDPGYALELMIAEYHDRPTLVGFMTEAIPRLSRAVSEAHSMDELEQLRVLFAEHLQEMNEILKMCCGEGGDDEDAA
jgi:hypothetical protein